jgi:hypothetical protein
MEVELGAEGGALALGLQDGASGRLDFRERMRLVACGRKSANGRDGYEPDDAARHDGRAPPDANRRLLGQAGDIFGWWTTAAPNPSRLTGNKYYGTILLQ